MLLSVGLADAPLAAQSATIFAQCSALRDFRFITPRILLATIHAVTDGGRRTDTFGRAASGGLWRI
jgi:hypothetical protein